ncbi:MAG: serine/threonine protein kinase [Planctomycetales bacterium]|nr:serine/threonine protein kinase [Planctomycetales bacterium]
MIPQIPCPSLSELESLLAPSASSNTDLERHLDTCESCRRKLMDSAVQADWCADACETLSSEQDTAALQRISRSICALADQTRREGSDLHEIELEQLRPLLDPPSHPELIGRLGRYELEQLIGRGGMGLVFRAFDGELHRVVAVKTLATHLIPISSARQRFVREGRAAASLAHPHIVPVFDVITEERAPALVMQFIAGPTLDQWLLQHGPLPWQQVIQLGTQLASALSAAHVQGIVHRDIKPGNVLLEAEASRALLADFGLARTLQAATLTHSGMLAGTPDFMSPEQAHGKNVDTASDLFSFGSVLYTMLCGQPPFRSTDAMATMNRICHRPHIPVMQVTDGVPVELSSLIDRLLAKDPRRRPSQASQVAELLQHMASAPVRFGSPKRYPSLKVSTWGLIAILILVLAVSPLLLQWMWPTQNTTKVQSLVTAPQATHRPNFTSQRLDEFGRQFITADSILQDLEQRVQSLHQQVFATESQSANRFPEFGLDIDQQLNQLRRQVQSLETQVEANPIP